MMQPLVLNRLISARQLLLIKDIRFYVRNTCVISQNRNCCANQLTGFSMRAALAFYGLIKL